METVNAREEQRQSSVCFAQKFIQEIWKGKCLGLLMICIKTKSRGMVEGWWRFSEGVC